MRGVDLPDTTLEVALEAVLARYGIPLYHVGRGLLADADRGDLASDLASAARAVAATSTGATAQRPVAALGPAGTASTARDAQRATEAQGDEA